MERRLGLSDEQTLAFRLLSQYNDISKQIGKGIDDKSLTSQHNDLKVMIQKEIDVAEQRYRDEENRITEFTYEQHEISKTISEFKLFMESWKRMAAESAAMKRKIIKLERENNA